MPRLTLLALTALPLLAQAPATVDFPFADVHPTPATAANAANLYRRGPTLRGGRYELRSATMLDLVSIAYSVDDDKVLGGPSWLEVDRYDIVAKAPSGSSVDAFKPALQQLLTARFHLVAHNEVKPLPTFALTTGKKPSLKESDGSGAPGCHPQEGNGKNGPSLFMGNADGTTTTISLGPGMTVTFNCRNITMAQFTAGLPNMMFSAAGKNPVLDRTGLTGHYDFDLHWSINLIGPANADAAEHISFADAIDHQLGLKLEPATNPTPVIVVDSAERRPTANLSDIAERLNVPPLPTEFEVAALKPADPGRRGMIQRRVQPGGRVELQSISVNDMIIQAWGLTPDMVVNAPSWATQDRYDVYAKVNSPEEIEYEDIWPLVRKLLQDRFSLKAHMEDRPVDAWRLVALKPKMKKADPNSRTHAQNVSPDRLGARGANTAVSRHIEFQNTTMAELCDQLRRMAGGYIRTSVADETHLDGGYDFNLDFSPAGMVGGRGGRAGAAMATASDVANDAAEPSGAISLPEAVEKQLGLKLEQQKRPAPVLVIDSIERKPIDN